MQAERPASSPERPVTPDTVGVVLLNLGGPTTLDDVEPFLYNLFEDVIGVSLPPFLQWLSKPLSFLIARKRAPESQVGYASIGGGSPLLTTTHEQGRALEAALEERGIDAKAYVAMRYPPQGLRLRLRMRIPCGCACHAAAHVPVLLLRLEAACKDHGEPYAAMRCLSLYLHPHLCLLPGP